MSSFKLHKTGGPYGDETSNYIVLFSKEMTVKEFIFEVLKDKREWGSINLLKDGDKWYQPSYKVEYTRPGKLKTPLSTIPLKILNTKIKSVKSNGGWSLMNYDIKLDLKKEKLKIFEKKEFTDGGPNDRGVTIGYIKAASLKEAKKILNINHNFIQLFEISDEEFRKRKRKAWANYKMYKL